MRSRLIVALIGGLLLPVPVDAQEAVQAPDPAPASSPSCALHPSPDCRYFGVTEIGFAVGADRREPSYYFPESNHQGELSLEGGVMRNLGSRDAVGATWFFKVADETLSTGPGARYRHWLTKRQSVDLGLGVPVASGNYERGTLFGLARYSPTQWVAISVRPERIRREMFVCGSSGCGFERDDEFRVLAGGDLTGRPGLFGLAGYGIAAGLVVLLLMVSLNE